MKLNLSKLNSKGMSHIIIPLIVVISAAVAGTYFIVASHAQVPPPDKFVAFTCSYVSTPSKPVAGKLFTVKATIKNYGTIPYNGSAGVYFALAGASNSKKSVNVSSMYAGQSRTYTLSVYPYLNATTKVAHVDATFGNHNGGYGIQPVTFASICFPGKTW